MAYASVVSVAQILEQLLHSDLFPVLYPKPQIESLQEKVLSLQASLEAFYPVPKTLTNLVNDQESQIREAMYNVQDTIEIFIYKQINSSESEEISGDVQDMINNIDAVAKLAEELAGEYRGDQQRGDPLSGRPSFYGYSGKSDKIVGQEDDMELVMREVRDEATECRVVSITGLPGVGKTTLVRSIYESVAIGDQFDIRAWVTVSQEYNVRDIFVKLIGSVESTGPIGADARKDEVSQLIEDLRKKLFEKRYLVVIDDIWGTEVWEEIRSSFPDNNNGSRIVITSRDADVAKSVGTDNFCHTIRPLDSEKSWELLREKVFAGRECPLYLEPIGRRIAVDCGGIPITIAVVGGQLSQGRKTVEYWESVEVVHDATARYEDPELEILSQSYHHLPGRLKGCFLYMRAFPEDCQIHVSKLIKLWTAEGFLPQAPQQCVEQVATQYLKDLIDRNLITVLEFHSDGQPKTCSIQGILRKLALRECQKEQFFHVADGYDGLVTESERRISVHKNILMCMEDIVQRTNSNKLARTFLYAGPNHHHPLPFSLTFDLLRVLDALSVYFLELPNEIFKLIHLRYLAFTCDEDIPPEISELRNLLVLIVHQHPKNIFRYASILPVEIWNMPQLRHLWFQEMDFPHPFPQAKSILFENLQSLSNVNAASCTEQVLQNMPNLKKLGVWVEEPGEVNLNLDKLYFLEALKFTVLKPIPGKAVSFRPRLLFPITLSKLNLSGCSLSWEDMTVIGLLPKLEVLKLLELAFHGEEWILEEDEGMFSKLKFLLLESLNLVFLGR